MNRPKLKVGVIGALVLAGVAVHAVSILRADSYPTTARHSITRMVYDLGGSDSVNQTASESARTEALTFLSRHVQQQGSGGSRVGANQGAAAPNRRPDRQLGGSGVICSRLLQSLAVAGGGR
ncbi:MAG: hypothetical protein JXA57_12375 [Armatimonadetes bacterium]|nr:hypothetical protein [Armatimonadota bacterium]